MVKSHRRGQRPISQIILCSGLRGAAPSAPTCLPSSRNMQQQQQPRLRRTSRPSPGSAGGSSGPQPWLQRLARRQRFLSVFLLAGATVWAASHPKSPIPGGFSQFAVWLFNRDQESRFRRGKSKGKMELSVEQCGGGVFFGRHMVWKGVRLQSTGRTPVQSLQARELSFKLSFITSSLRLTSFLDGTATVRQGLLDALESSVQIALVPPVLSDCTVRVVLDEQEDEEEEGEERQHLPAYTFRFNKLDPGRTSYIPGSLWDLFFFPEVSLEVFHSPGGQDSEDRFVGAVRASSNPSPEVLAALTTPEEAENFLAQGTVAAAAVGATGDDDPQEEAKKEQPRVLREKQLVDLDIGFGKDLARLTGINLVPEPHSTTLNRGVVGFSSLQIQQSDGSYEYRLTSKVTDPEIDAACLVSPTEPMQKFLDYIRDLPIPQVLEARSKTSSPRFFTADLEQQFYVSAFLSRAGINSTV